MGLFWSLGAVASAWICGQVTRAMVTDFAPFIQEQVDSETAALYLQVLRPVLDEGGRAGNAVFRFDASTNTIIVLSEVGEYRIRLTQNRQEAYPREGLPEVQVHGGWVSSEIVLHVGDAMANATMAQGKFRSMLRADPYLHPHLREGEGQRLQLSYPQRKAEAALLTMEKIVSGKKGLKRALVTPVGFGKTVISASYVQSLGTYHQQLRTVGWKRKPRVIFVVEDSVVLDRTVETYAETLGFTKVAKIYGEDTRAKIPADVEMVAISRSMYASRMKEIHKLLDMHADQPWVIVCDEAHHLGRTHEKGSPKGQFEAILKDLEKHIDGRHRVLLLSATLWHPDRDLITGYLEGNIHGAFLTAEEQALLRRGESLPELCRTQFMRGMEEGYLSPMIGVHLISRINGTSTADILTGTVLDREAARRHIQTYPALLQDVRDRIIATKNQNVPNRGIIFVDSRARADAYAEELSKLLGEEVRSLHRGEGVDPSTLQWFSDKGRFASDENKGISKYLVVVDMLKEGVDIPGINLVILLRRYGQDMRGFRNLMQNLGRGARNASNLPYFKPAVRVLDYSLYTKWLRDGMARISVEPHSSGGGAGTQSAYMVVNDVLLDPLEFSARELELFPEDLTFARAFRYFDLGVFQTGGFRTLHEQSPSFGVPVFTLEYGVREMMLRLAERLPPSPEQQALLRELRSPEWGWLERDGLEMPQVSDPEQPVNQRIFRALHRIAQLASLSHPEIDVNKIHEAKEVEKLLDGLYPDRPQSLYRIEDRRVLFSEKRGAWAALVAEAEERNLGKVSDPGGIQKLMEALGADLTDPKARARYLLRLEGIEFAASDGAKMNTAAYQAEQTRESDGRVRTSGPVQRIYRAFYLLAWELKQGGADIDLSKLHERGEAEKVLKLLNERRVGVWLTEATREIFWNENEGAAQVFAERCLKFGVPSFARDYAPREILVALASRVESAEKETFIAGYYDERWEWSKKDGAMILFEFYSNPADRFFRGIARLAAHVNRSIPGANIDLQKLHTRKEAERLFDVIILGFVIPTASEKQFEQFREEVVPLLRDAAKDLGIRAYVTDFGPKRLAQRLADELFEKAPEDPRVLALRDALADDAGWGWKKADGETIASGLSLRATENLQRALSAISTLQAQRTDGRFPRALSSVRQFADLVAWQAD